MSSQDWFNGEIAEQIEIKNRLLKKFKHSKLNVDDLIFKE